MLWPWDKVAIIQLKKKNKFACVQYVGVCVCECMCVCIFNFHIILFLRICVQEIFFNVWVENRRTEICIMFGLALHKNGKVFILCGLEEVGKGE